MIGIRVWSGYWTVFLIYSLFLLFISWRDYVYSLDWGGFKLGGLDWKDFWVFFLALTIMHCVSLSQSLRACFSHSSWNKWKLHVLSTSATRSFISSHFIYALINIAIFAFAYANWIEGYKYGQLNMQIPHFDAQPSISYNWEFLHLPWVLFEKTDHK